MEVPPAALAITTQHELEGVGVIRRPLLVVGVPCTMAPHPAAESPMKAFILLVVVAAASSCVSPKIPDNIPPAPPAPTAEYSAPSDEPEGEMEDDGFGGGDGFGGETPAIDVEDAAESEETSEESEESEKPADGEPAADASEESADENSAEP